MKKYAQDGNDNHRKMRACKFCIACRQSEQEDTKQKSAKSQNSKARGELIAESVEAGQERDDTETGNSQCEIAARH